jgi:hypothetical protein
MASTTALLLANEPLPGVPGAASDGTLRAVLVEASERSATPASPLTPHLDEEQSPQRPQRRSTGSASAVRQGTLVLVDVDVHLSRNGSLQGQTAEPLADPMEDAAIGHRHHVHHNLKTSHEKRARNEGEEAPSPATTECAECRRLSGIATPVAESSTDLEPNGVRRISTFLVRHPPSFVGLCVASRGARVLDVCASCLCCGCWAQRNLQPGPLQEATAEGRKLTRNGWAWNQYFLLPACILLPGLRSPVPRTPYSSSCRAAAAAAAA